MTTAIKRRRGTTAQHATFTGLEGELTIDTTKDTVVVHDGATAGGFPLAKESQATTNVAITGGTITGITDLAVADGGTGASTAANARTNLGVTATGTDTTYAYRANNLSDLASASTARTNLGLGTISTQAASSIAITGGTIDGTVIGGTTRAAGSFTTVTTTNNASISGLTVGKGGGANSFSTAFGNSALNATNTQDNAAFGWAALYSNTSGGSNTAVGSYNTLYANTTGSYNTAVGRQALTSNTTASNNTAVGFQAGYANTTGTNITAIGQGAAYASTVDNVTAVGTKALTTNTTGSGVVAVGADALRLNTTGNAGTAVGQGSLYANTTGASNTAIGYTSLYSNTTASNNTAVGYQAGYSNTTGGVTAMGYKAGYANTTGLYNTFVGGVDNVYGASCGTANTTGLANSAFGGGALASNTTSGYNTAIGVGSLILNTGSQNTALGYLSGSAVTTGSKNTILGSYNGNQGGLDIRTASNYIVLSDGDGNPRLYSDGSGNWITGGSLTVNNYLNSTFSVAGGNLVSLNNTSTSGYGISQTCNSSNTTYRYFEGYSSSAAVQKVAIYTDGNIRIAAGSTYGNLSDAKLKENIVDATSKLEDICKLQVRNFGLIGEKNSKVIGFIAQEFETVFPALVFATKDEQRNEDGSITLLETETKGIKESALIPILVKAIQELNTKLEAQALEIATLKAK